MVEYFTQRKWASVTAQVRERILSGPFVECFLNLAGYKTVRVVAGEAEALRLLRREFAWILTDPVDKPDATIYLWKEDDVKEFIRNGLIINEPVPAEDKYLVLKVTGMDDGIKAAWNSGQVNIAERTVYLSDEDSFYYGTTSFSPLEWINDGHLLVQLLFRTLNESANVKLVHGACVGIDGKGLLLCARGQKGKSTLAMTAMLKGMEFVSEDYLILENGDDGLRASPIYSMMTLSPFMYDKLYDGLGKARFMGVGPFKGKYLFDISGYKDQVRSHYPIRACIFPEIDPSAAVPSIELCDIGEKNRAITHMAHSTLYQMWCGGLKRGQRDQDYILALIRMLRGLDFYKITLTPDIFANADALMEFANSLS